MNVVFGVVAVLGTLLLAQMAAEVRDWSSWVAPRLVRRAAARLPLDCRDARAEEWLAELEALDGLKFVKLAFALRLQCAALRMRRTDRRARRQESLNDRRMTAFFHVGYFGVPAVLATPFQIGSNWFASWLGWVWILFGFLIFGFAWLNIRERLLDHGERRRRESAAP